MVLSEFYLPETPTDIYSRAAVSPGSLEEFPEGLHSSRNYVKMIHP